MAEVHDTHVAHAPTTGESFRDQRLEAAWGQAALLFEGASDTLLLLDREGRVLASQRGLAGLDPERLRGTRLVDLSEEPTQAIVLAAHGDAISPGLSHTVEAGFSDAGGHSRTYSLAFSPVRGPGDVDGVLVVARETTAQRREIERLRRSERLMVDAQGLAHLGTWEWDPSEPHAMWSPELFAIYGLDPDRHTPTYQDYLSRVHPDDRKCVQVATERVFNDHQPYSHDERIYRADGELRYLHTWAEAVLDEHGALDRLVGVCLDITDRKVAEMAVERHLTELQVANDHLEQFAYISSHDLQEPLRMVSSYAQLLARRYEGQLDEEADEYIEFIREGVTRLHQLIGDFHAYAQVGREHRPTDVSLSDLASTVLTDLAPDFEAAGATVTVHELPMVTGDERQLYLVLRHLLANAIKFRGNDPPRIEVSATRADTAWQVRIEDNGIGVDPIYADRIFQIFQRLHHRADFPGTGVGLALCKRAIEAHAGRIWVEPRDKRPGAAFVFTLPDRSPGTP